MAHPHDWLASVWLRVVARPTVRQPPGAEVTSRFHLSSGPPPVTTYLHRPSLILRLPLLGFSSTLELAQWRVACCASIASDLSLTSRGIVSVACNIKVQATHRGASPLPNHLCAWDSHPGVQRHMPGRQTEQHAPRGRGRLGAWVTTTVCPLCGPCDTYHGGVPALSWVLTSAE